MKGVNVQFKLMLSVLHVSGEDSMAWCKVLTKLRLLLIKEDD